ncbi:META domain-containing protein [Arthrobacter sp. FW305-123]|nr:META domain-containing protein [Arthrobacter sp. FW305-123]
MRLVTVVFTVLLGGCAQVGSGSSGPGSSGAASETTQRPLRSCETPLGCSGFTSVRGSDAAGDVAWLGTDPLRVTSARFDGVWTLLINTPCNYLQVEVSAHDDVALTPGLRSVTDRGCEGPTASYQAWTEKLFDQPVQWTLDGDTLTLKNSHATIELKEN